MAAIYKRAVPYKDDILNLPVLDIDAALLFYETVMGFHLISRSDDPPRRAILEHGDVRMGIAENGGDPGQEGAFIEVNDIEAAFAELKANGLAREEPGFRIDRHGETSYRVFFVIAPDGLCYCLGERVDYGE